MGTRGLVQVFRHGEYEGEEYSYQLTRIYRQYDCYPSGMGRDLANFLDGAKVVNGISSREGRQFNGASDLTAQLIHYLKDDGSGTPTIGNVYVYAVGEGEDWKDPETCWQEWVYNIFVDGNTHEIEIQVWDVYDKKEYFRGSVPEFVSKLDSKQ